MSYRNRRRLNKYESPLFKKLPDDLFNTLLHYNDKFFAKKFSGTEPLESARQYYMSPFPGGELASFRITDKQYKKVLHYCFDEKYTEDMKDYFISKYHFAINIFFSCVSSKDPDKKPTKRDIRMYGLCLDELIKTGLSFSELIDTGLFYTSYFGLGKIAMDYLNKVDIYPDDEPTLDSTFLGRGANTDVGFSYRGYDNARIFNSFLEAYCGEIRDVFDLDNYKLPDKFPYTIKEVKNDDGNQ